MIDRINELARKAKTKEGLTETEIKERAELREKYLENFRKNFKSTILDNIYIVEENGEKTKLIQEEDSQN
ncbi:MAG: DUF896 domain-containing protein [bacterium]